jgi:sRNA-binding carbon storage regulator CsrA
MALVLEVPIGNAVYVNDTRVTLTDILNPTTFRIEVDDGMMIRKMEIGVQQREEIMPGVNLFAGMNVKNRRVRMSFEAPQHVKILREKLYNDGSRSKRSD